MIRPAGTADPREGEPIRVAHVVESLEVGGLEKLLVDFARHTDRARFAPRVVTLGDRGQLADEVESLGWPVTALRARPGLKPRSVLRLAQLFRRDAIEVVHTHSEGPLIYGTAAARLARVRRIVHTRHHGPDLGSPRHVLAMMSLAARAVDRVVCVADAGARHAIAEGIKPSKVVTIWNGIDLDRFAYRGPEPGGPAVIVARLIPEKDHASLLRAVAQVVAVEPSFRLEIAGEGQCEAELRQLASDLGLLDGPVRFLGRVDDVPALLRRASLLVQPSLMEGISLTLLEAMACGLPVVTTRVGGNPEVVGHGETGRLVPVGEPRFLADAVLHYWRDPSESRRAGRAGRERAERWFDIRRTVRSYEALYDPSCETSSASAAPRRDRDLVGAGEP